MIERLDAYLKEMANNACYNAVSRDLDDTRRAMLDELLKNAFMNGCIYEAEKLSL